MPARESRLEAILDPSRIQIMSGTIPRRTYTQSHMDYAIEVCAQVASRAADLKGYRIVDEPPALRHFSARFEQLSPA